MKIFYLFIFIISFFLLPSTTKACLGFGCNSNYVLLGEVISNENKIADVKPFHIFPNSILKINDIIRVEDSNNELTPGKKYALSLYKKDELYSPVWQIIEIEGTSHENARLLKLKTSSDYEVQLFINSNGKGPEITSYYGNGEKLFLRIGPEGTPSSQDIQIYPKTISNFQVVLLLIGSFLIGALSVLLFTRNFRK